MHRATASPLQALRQASLTLLRRKGQLPSVQGQLQGRVLLSHKRLKIQGEGHDILPDLKQKKALSAPHCHTQVIISAIRSCEGKRDRQKSTRPGATATLIFPACANTAMTGPYKNQWQRACTSQTHPHSNGPTTPGMHSRQSLPQVRSWTPTSHCANKYKL